LSRCLEREDYILEWTSESWVWIKTNSNNWEIVQLGNWEIDSSISKFPNPERSEETKFQNLIT
jgi:hypothetical protein